MGEPVPMQSETPDVPAAQNDGAGGDSSDLRSLPDNMRIDYITGDVVADSPEEEVRQRISRALSHEYGIAVDDMARDLSVAIEIDGKKRRRRIDIAIFSPSTGHTLENLRRVVVCKPEPKNCNTITRIRSPQQAENCLLYTSPSPRDRTRSRMPSSA